MAYNEIKNELEILWETVKQDSCKEQCQMNGK
jgi:hypothetical protein